MNKFWVVALETFKRNVKSVAFIVMILSPFLMIGLSLAGGYFGGKFNETSSIAVVSENQAIRESFIKDSTITVEPNIKTEKEAQKALEEDDIDGYLVTELVGEKIEANYTGTSTLGTEDVLSIEQILSSYQLGLTSQELKLSANDVEKLMSKVALTSKNVEFKDGEMTEKSSNQLALTMGAFFLSLAMYMIILMYAQVTASEVASEKGTRIMEIILSSTTASKHFYGKIMGIFLVILTQIGVYLVVGLGGYLIMKDSPMVKDLLAAVPLKDLVIGIFGYNMLFLLFGVIIFTILSALCGSLVSKAEDAGKAVTPVSYLTLFGFMVSMMFGMANPQHIMMKITSYIPFLSSFTMPSRIASGTVETSGVLLSLGILVVATLLLLKVSASIYQSSALSYSDTGMWKTFTRSFASMKHENKSRKHK